MSTDNTPDILLYSKSNVIHTERIQSSPCIHLAKKLLSRVPLLFTIIPAMITYAFTRSTKVLNAYYTLRSLLYAIPYKQGVRVSKQDGVLMYYPAIEDPNFVDVWIRNVYGVYKPKTDDIVFDIGAHMGFFTLKVARYVKKVVAFEPDLHNLRYLLLNIKLNKVSNVEIYRLAIGEENRMVYLKKGFGGGRTRVTNTPTDTKVRMITIDSFVLKTGIVPTIMKIDTEGYELNVLKGAKNTLQKFKPKLLIASYHYPAESIEVIHFLMKLGYKCIAYYVPLFLRKESEVYVYAHPE